MKLFRWIVAGLLVPMVLLPAAVLVLLMFDTTAVGNRVAAWVSGQIGRELAIDGAVQLQLGRTIRLSLQGLRLANAPWGSRPDMLSAGHVLIEIDSWSLVDHPVVIRRVEVEKLDLSLERTQEGDNNWALGPGDNGNGFTWPERLPVILEQITLPGAHIRFAGPRLTQPLDLRFVRLAQDRGTGGMLLLSGGGSANEAVFEMQASAGPLEGLISGRNFGLSLDANLGEATVAARVRIDDLAHPVDSRLQLTLRGPDAGYLASRFAIRDLGSGPVRLDASVVPLEAGRGLSGSLSGEVGEFRINGSGRLTEPLTMEELAFQVDASGPDLSLVGGLVGVNLLPPAPFDLKVSVERKGERLRISDGVLALPDSRLDLKGQFERISTMEGSDIDFRLQGSDVARFRRLLHLPGLAEGPFQLAGRLHQSPAGAERLEIDATTTLGRFSLSGDLGKSPDYRGTRLSFDATGPSLARIGRAADLAGLPDAQFSAAGEFDLQPASLAFSRSTLKVSGNELGWSGNIGKAPLGRDTDLRFSLKGGNLQDLAALTRVEGLPAGPYEVQGRLRRLQAASRFDEVRGRLAGAGFTLRGRVADRFTRDTEIIVSLEGPQLDAFAGLLPRYPWPPGPFRLDGGLLFAEKKIELRNLQFSAAGANGRVNASLALPLDSVRGRFDLRAQGPDLSRLLPQLGDAGRRGGDFDLELSGVARDGSWDIGTARLTSGAGSITASGGLVRDAGQVRAALRLEARAASLADAGHVFGVALPPEPFELSATLSGTPAAFRIDQASGRIGATDFAGSVSLDRRVRPVLDLSFEAKQLDLGSYLKGVHIGEPAKKPIAATRLIPDEPLPLGMLDAFDGSVDVRAGRVLLANTEVQDLRLRARLDGGNLALDTLDLRLAPDTGFSIRGGLLRGSQGRKWQVDATGTHIPLGPAADTPAQRLKRPHADLDLRFTARGETFAEIARTMNGRLQLAAGSGEVPAGGTGKLFSTLRRELVAIVQPKRRDQAIRRIACMTVVATATDGKVRTAPVLAVQFEDASLVSYGTVDLDTEKINFYLKTTPSGRLDINVGEIVNPYVKVTGTFMRPALAVDTKGALFNSAAAVATGGLSVVAKGTWERLFRTKDPCAAALAAAERLAAETGSSANPIESQRRGPLRR